MTDTKAASATIVGLNHDLKSRRSFVLIEWDDNAEKHFSLPVPFGCSLDDLPRETAKAVRGLSVETASLNIRSAD